VVVEAVTAILGVGVIAVEFSPGNVPVGEAVFLRGGVVRNEAWSEPCGGLRRLAVLPEGTASAYNVTSDWERAFGTWQLGQVLVLEWRAYSVVCRQGGAWGRLRCTVEAV
jgi:hypothetical protein